MDDYQSDTGRKLRSKLILPSNIPTKGSNSASKAEIYFNGYGNFGLSTPFAPIRYEKGLSIRKMIHEMVQHYSGQNDLESLIFEASLLPREFIDILYRFGVKIYLVSKEEREKTIEIEIMDKIVSFPLEKLRHYKHVGFYSRRFRLILISESFFAKDDLRLFIYEAAKAFKDAMLSNKNLRRTPYKASLEDFPLGQKAVAYTLRINSAFEESSEGYFLPERAEKIYEEDPIMHYFLESLYDKVTLRTQKSKLRSGQIKPYHQDFEKIKVFSSN